MYRFYLIPDYSKDQSVIVVKYHRAFSDGLALTTLFHSASAVVDTRAVPTMRPTQIFWKLLAAVLSPYLITFELFKMAMKFPEENVMKSSSFIGGHKNLALLENMKLSDLRSVSHLRKVTVNDTLLALLSTSLYDFFYFKKFQRRYDEVPIRIPSSLQISIPYSFREGVVDME